MLPVVAAIVALLSARAAGGRLGRLRSVTFRYPWLPVLAFGVQVLIISFIELPGAVAAAIHVCTYVPLAAFFWVNRRQPGLLLLILGLAANLAAIAANGGVMPADQHALERAGLADEDAAFENSAVVENPKLSWLGDVFAWPEPLPLANVFSVGDVLVVAGVGVFAHRTSRSLLTADGRRERREAGAAAM